MLRISFPLVFLLLAVSWTSAESEKFNQDADWQSATSLYDFHAADIEGHDVALDKYRDNVVIIVNVASNCGYTARNYQQLQQLYNEYRSKGLRILAFPSNQFMNQEPGTNEEISQFVQQYNVTFDMFSKIDVNGENAHPLWKWLQQQKVGEIKWNFTKFIVDRNGKLVERFAPAVDPLEMEATLKKYL